MAHWILQSNPSKYRLLDALRDGFEINSWTIAQLRDDIATGDDVAMWISGSGSGIYAFGVVTKQAEWSAIDPDPYWVDPEAAAEPAWRVGIRLDHPLAAPIPRAQLKSDPEFADALIISIPGGRNPFRVTDRQWKAVTSRVAASTRHRTRSNNPGWTRDELILALDLYLRARGHIPSPRDDQVVQLSDLLNRLPIHTVRPDLEKFRNPNGVVLKITNFAALDPVYLGAGMSRGSRMDVEVWDQYAGHADEVSRIAGAIRSAAASPLLSAVPDVGEDDIEADEGRILARLHRVRERDRKLIDRKKTNVFASQGSLACEVCTFDFAETYGALGERFIEAHHIVPLADAGVSKTRLADLALVCSNCHRMLHRARPWMTPGQLQGLLFENGNAHKERVRPGSST